MAESITTSMIEPAFALLGINSSDSSAQSELCCVVTSTTAPHVIRTADDAWCRTWEVLPHEASGKTLELIAGPRSSNISVGARLAAASPTAKASISSARALSHWVDCGKSINYTTRSLAPVEHHLVIGPVRDDRGEVKSLIGVSRILSPIDSLPGEATPAAAADEADEPLFASFMDSQSPSETAALFAAAFARPLAPAASPSRRSSHRVNRFRPQLRRKPVRRTSALDVIVPAPAEPAGTAAPQLPMRFATRTYAPSSSPLVSSRFARTSDASSPPLSPPEREVSYAEMLADEELSRAEDELIFRSMLERTDARIVLASMCRPGDARSASEGVRQTGDAFTFKRIGRAPNAPVPSRRRLSSDFVPTRC